MAVRPRARAIAAIASHLVFYPGAYVLLYLPTVYWLGWGAPALLVELVMASTLFVGLQAWAGCGSSLRTIGLLSVSIGVTNSLSYMLLVALNAPGHIKVWPVEGAPVKLAAIASGVMGIGAAAQIFGRLWCIRRVGGRPVSRVP